MVHLLATICTVALACAGVAQGMSLVQRSCPNDGARPMCETSDGSPLAWDCLNALKKISGTCKQSNGGHSKCTTVATWNSCKVDVCGDKDLSLLPGINCGGYLQSVYNDCTQHGQVGGQLHPSACNIAFPGGSAPAGGYEYRLQFSHSGYGKP